MGWSTTHRRDGQSVVDFFREEFRFADTSESAWKIIDSARPVPRELYMVCEYERGPKIGKRFAIVVLLEKPGKDDRPYYNISYKEMDESSHPYYYNCPARLLDQLSEPGELFGEYTEDSINWRAACREQIAKSATAKALKPGMIIKLAAPLNFTNGVAAEVFKYAGKSSFYALFDGRPGFLCKISRWRERDFTVEAAA